MVKYDPKSARAEEFIHHGEILDTLTYAAENKSNRALIERLLTRAADCKSCMDSASFYSRPSIFPIIVSTAASTVLITRKIKISVG